MQSRNILLALATSAALAAPIPNEESCGSDVISFLRPRSRSIFSIRSHCDEVLKHTAQDILKRDSSRPSLLPVSLPPLPLFEDSDEVADASSDFQLVSSPAEDGDGVHTFILATDRTSGKTQLIETEFDNNSNPFTAYGNVDEVGSSSWNEHIQHETQGSFITVTGLPPALEVAAVAMVFIMVAAMLMFEMVLTARTTGWSTIGSRFRRRRFAPSISFSAPTIDSEKFFGSKMAKEAGAWGKDAFSVPHHLLGDERFRHAITMMS